MNSNQLIHKSKFLSLVLRHEPGRIGIALDPAGWVDVAELLAKCARHGFQLTADDLRQVVVENDKQRFEFSRDTLRIRASQGHSVSVELGYPPAIPPELLYHGTVAKYLESIRRDGLVKGERHHVHLSPDEKTAERVGQRRGRPVILAIRAGQMHRAGLVFFLSANGVWLTDHVPPRYIQSPKEEP